jgi:hypothetical protein
VPAFWGFFQVWSFGPAPEPLVKFHCHRRKEVPLLDSIYEVFAEGSASGISWRPDPDSRHDLADGVDNPSGNALRLFGAGLGLFEAGVKISQSLLWRFLLFAAASGRCRTS